jgi:hypothetical protein
LALCWKILDKCNTIKKRFLMKLFLKALRVSCLVFPLLLACGERGVRFSGGEYGFLLVDNSPPGANRARLSLVDYGGRKAVRVELLGGGAPYIAIDASSLLGKSVGRLREMQVTIGVENPTGNFYAVSGDIYAYSGPERRVSRDPWSVYLPERNPNIARAVLDAGEEFVPGAYNFFILARREDVALGEGAPPSHLVISEIHFYEEGGKELRVNPGALFDAPEGFGERDRSNLLASGEETYLEKSEGKSKNWGQAVTLDAAKNGGPLDGALFGPDAVVTVYYSSAAPPELILQSWTPGAPAGSGWAKVAPAAVNGSSSAAQYLGRDMAAAFGTGDFATWLDRVYVGDTGEELTVYAVTLCVLSPQGG